MSSPTSRLIPPVPLLALLFLLLMPALGQAKVWQVAHPEDNSIQGIQEAFLMAQPGDEIVIEAGVYLTDENVDADYPFALRNKSGIAIRSEGGAYLLATKPHTTPAIMEFCDNVSLENVHFGHAATRGTCTGMVLVMRMCTKITFSGCVLHGSGIVGVSADRCDYVTFQECAIVDCTQTAVWTMNCSEFSFTDCLFANNDDSYVPDLLFSGDPMNGSDAPYVNCLMVDNKGLALGLLPYDLQDTIIARNSFEEHSGDMMHAELIAAMDQDYFLDLSKAGGIGPRSNTAAERYRAFRQLAQYPGLAF